MLDKIKELEEIISKNDNLYWAGNTVISDEEYDAYVEELKKIDPNNKLITRVNETIVSSVGKVNHLKPMLSLDKVYTLQNLFSWVKNKSRDENEMFLIQPKYDGISGKIQNYDLFLKDVNSVDVVLSTRGNGFIGENISNKLPIIEFKTNKKDSEFIYGEILITKDDFKNIFANIVSPSSKKPYKNPRNATAGIMGCDDIDFFKKQNAKLTFVDYDLNSYEISAKDFESKWEEIENKIISLPYPMDGIVIKLKDKEYGEKLGVTAHHPKNAIAFKFSNPQKDTQLIDVFWSYGKNYLTPVAIFKPIEINGVTITKASLANYSNLKKLNCNIGDIITVERSGDVIPTIIKVKKVENKDNKNLLIEYCPCCKTKLIVKEPEIYCPNNNCEEKIVRRLLFSIRSIGIDGIGIPTLKKIINYFKIDNLYDFMMLNRFDLSKAGFGEKTIENIANSIYKSTNIYDYQLLTCLNITDVGDEVSKLILEKYTFDDLINTVTFDNLINIKGIGEKTASKIIGYIKYNKNYIIQLRSIFSLNRSLKNNFSSDITVCFTGAMEQPRKYYENIAKEKNIITVNTVSKNLTYLVVADINSNSSKTQKAKKYGITILSLEEFLSL